MKAISASIRDSEILADPCGRCSMRHVCTTPDKCEAKLTWWSHFKYQDYHKYLVLYNKYVATLYAVNEDNAKFVAAKIFGIIPSDRDFQENSHVIQMEKYII